MFEFYADPSAVPNLNAALQTFSTFLGLCADDPSGVAEMLAPAGLSRWTEAAAMDAALNRFRTRHRTRPICHVFRSICFARIRGTEVTVTMPL
jgi:hypothetical protein